MAETLVIHGNEACARAAIAAGCRFFAGYPITPASEITEIMSRLLPKERGVFLQMEDEISSICIALGAAWGGAKACTATSGPGFTLMQEGIGWAAETDTPIVVINVMRGGPATGQPTSSSQQDVMQAKYGSHGDYEIIALVPSGVQEAFDLTVRAFHLAEKYRNPVVVLTDEIVGHTREKIRIPAGVPAAKRAAPQSEPSEYVPFRPGPDGMLDGMPSFNAGFGILVDGQLHDENGLRAGHKPEISAAMVERICRKITDHADELVDTEEWMLDDAEVVLVTYGSPARPALRAAKDARARGIRAGFLKMRILWPFPEKVIDRVAGRTGKILVPEMNIGKICREVSRVAAGRAEVISLPKLGGEVHTPSEILEALEKIQPQRTQSH
ncbi:MAG TPA: 2-oxoacid:acceptor oxidoreductase subunit alpha [Thermodesulfobacteriota bacterium]|nr:2-oxoacid:acceptor oxidoreductase subunit alpha [Thermodesulfobacteriota bacterium]